LESSSRVAVAPEEALEAPPGAADDPFGRRLTQAFIRLVWHPLHATVRDAYQKQYYPLGYSPALDGLRGLMTVGIIVAHVRYPLVPGTLLYMDVFFVMSGYFITSLLVRDIQRHGRIRYGEFYRRRFARILPPLVAMLAGYLLYRLFFFPPFSKALLDAGIAFAYVTNWWRAFDLPGIAYMSHTWSLAIEEQFYLLWPITLMLFVRVLGLSWRLVLAIAALALAVWMWRIYLTWEGAPVWRLYNGTDTRADAFAVGCALAVVLKLAPAGRFPSFERFLPKVAWPFLVSSLVVTFFFVQWKDAAYYYVGIMLCGALPGSLLLIVLLRSSGTILHRILERPEPVFLGRIFYGMYLWHFPVLMILKDQFHVPNLPRFLIGLALTVLLATLSYAYIERHFMRVRATPTRAAPAGSAAVPL
jgi:peptidoglycan/LPS O-acetylase OafA/YrhL